MKTVWVLMRENWAGTLEILGMFKTSAGARQVAAEDLKRILTDEYGVTIRGEVEMEWVESGTKANGAVEYPTKWISRTILNATWTVEEKEVKP